VVAADDAPASSKGNKAPVKRVKVNDEPHEAIPEASATSEMPLMNERYDISSLPNWNKK
jgi:hypothetical protein